MAPFKIIAQLRLECIGHALSHDELYNSWNVLFMARFKCDLDPMISSLKYLEEAKHWKKSYHQHSPFRIAFMTNIGLKVLKLNMADELLIDSTYKANKQKLELFALMRLCFWTGFPNAYFLLGAGTTGQNRSRDESLSGFRERAPIIHNFITDFLFHS